AHFWAAPFEVGNEFGGLGLPSPFPADAGKVRHKAQARVGENTTIAIVATDARLTKSEAKRVAIMAHDGLARALWPVHTPFDGDLVFTIATGRIALGNPVLDLADIGIAAATVTARAIARGIYAATPSPGDRVPTWRERFRL